MLTFIFWLVHIGGHNILILARDLGHYIQLGASVDDAIGEAYDKTAKWLGLDLRKSGGPAVEELAQQGDEKSIQFKVNYSIPNLNWTCNMRDYTLKNYCFDVQ